MKKTLRCLIFFSSACVCAVALFSGAMHAQSSAAIPAPAVDYFPLADVRVTDPEIKNIQEKDKDYLLWLNPDSLLHYFRIEAGLPPKAPPYNGWESEPFGSLGPLRGGFMGYYLSSLALMQQSSPDPRLLARIKYVLSELQACAKAQGDGYILAIKDGKRHFAEIAAGNIRSDGGGSLNDMWAPVYLVSKMMRGLAEIDKECGLPEARELLTGLSDWFGTQIVDRLSDAQIQEMLRTEYGSITDSYVTAYEITGEKKYLAWAGRLNETAFWKPLAANNDILPGRHANTQIPKFIGFHKYYTCTGDARFAAAAENFWNIVLEKHTWSIGGNSMEEHFFEEKKFPERILNDGGPETCNSVNMLELTETLFRYRPSARAADYYERTLLNHIMSAHEPVTGLTCYYTPMRPGHYRIYGSQADSCWCCGQTGLESPAKFGKFIYAKRGDDLLVNLFVSSTLDWHERGLSLTQESTMPDANTVTLRFGKPRAGVLRLLVRKPSWIGGESATFVVNGKSATPSLNAEGYWIFDEAWGDANAIKITLPMRVRLETLPGSDTFVSLLYGPYVLAGKIAAENDPHSFWGTMDATPHNNIPIEHVPSFKLPAQAIPSFLKKATDKPVSFRVTADGFPESLRLEPFYRVHFQRYAVYWQTQN